MISFWRRRAAKDLARELDTTRVDLIGTKQLLADTQEALRARMGEVTGWQNHAATLTTDNEHLRRESEHWRQAYERVLEDGKHERQGLVQHVVDLKREGFGVGGPQLTQSEPPSPLPPVIARAIGMRDFDTNATRSNHAYALEQLRVRPDAADEIAKEILAGEQFDTYADSEEAAA